VSGELYFLYSHLESRTTVPVHWVTELGFTVVQERVHQTGNVKFVFRDATTLILELESTDV
jgi:hypothetical protein